MTLKGLDLSVEEAALAAAAGRSAPGEARPPLAERRHWADTAGRSPEAPVRKLGTETSARIVELFASVQGEGLLLGEPQVFVRFGGCNLHCDYCDEPETIPIPSGELMELDAVQSRVLELAKDRSWVSLTGGEPLLHEPFLKSLLPRLKERGLKTMLETNGTLPAAMRRLADRTDLVAMDVKLPSAGGRELWRVHEDFLRIAPKRSFVKVVVTDRTLEAEVEQAARVVARVDRDVPFFLQPATPVGLVRRPDPSMLLQMLQLARFWLRNARLTPQWHPIWGLP